MAALPWLRSTAFSKHRHASGLMTDMRADQRLAAQAGRHRLCHSTQLAPAGRLGKGRRGIRAEAGAQLHGREQDLGLCQVARACGCALIGPQGCGQDLQGKCRGESAPLGLLLGQSDLVSSTCNPTAPSCLHVCMAWIFVYYIQLLCCTWYPAGHPWCLRLYMTMLCLHACHPEAAIAACFPLEQ